MMPLLCDCLHNLPIGITTYSLKYVNNDVYKIQNMEFYTFKYI